MAHNSNSTALGFISHVPVSSSSCPKVKSFLSPSSKKFIVAAAPASSSRRCTSIQMSTADDTQPQPAPRASDEREILLAELAFSEPELLPKLVQDRINELDDGFYTFVQQKIADSGDLEERETLRILLDAITDVIKTISRNIPADMLEKLSREEIEEMQRQKIEEAYEEMYQQMVTLSDGIETAVKAMYDRVDVQFLQLLAKKIRDGEDAERATLVQNCIQQAMQTRMQIASMKLRDCLTAGGPQQMFEKLSNLALSGEVDESFVLLLAGNLKQAEAANNQNAVRILQELQNRAIQLRDQALDPEVALIRKLLRTDDQSARKNLLTQALQTKKKILLSAGSQPSSSLRVDGKKLVSALRKLISEFGNVDPELVERLSKIGSDAEEVAKGLFNIEDKDIRDLQDEAFHRRSLSVFDLERMEVEAEMAGNPAPFDLGPEPAGFQDGIRQL